MAPNSPSAPAVVCSTRQTQTAHLEENMLRVFKYGVGGVPRVKMKTNEKQISSKIIILPMYTVR